MERGRELAIRRALAIDVAKGSLRESVGDKTTVQRIISGETRNPQRERLEDYEGLIDEEVLRAASTQLGWAFIVPKETGGNLSRDEDLWTIGLPMAVNDLVFVVTSGEENSDGKVVRCGIVVEALDRGDGFRRKDNRVKRKESHWVAYDLSQPRFSAPSFESSRYFRTLDPGDLDEYLDGTRPLRPSHLSAQLIPGETEGQQQIRLHRIRDRRASKLLRSQLVNERQESGDGLKCAVCNFDYAEFYGERGIGFIECHHDVPLGQLSPGEVRTPTRDSLKLVCANCHRMLHRAPYFTVAELCTSLGIE
ncbi:hypothetical protein OAH18_03220 [bacterium]|nr:hypothetical protein [bacterium]